MLQLHLIFILYSLCASVFKGESTLDVAVHTDGRGVGGGGGQVQRSFVIVAHVSATLPIRGNK